MDLGVGDGAVEGPRALSCGAPARQAGLAAGPGGPCRLRCPSRGSALPSTRTLGGPCSPKRQVCRQGLGQGGKTQTARTDPGENLGSVAPHAPPASPEGGRWHGPTGIWGIIFPS